MSTALATPTITMTVDSPEWAWTEMASDLLASHEEEFFSEFTYELNAAAVRLLAPRLRHAWYMRSVEVIAMTSANEFGRWIEQETNTATHFAVWDEVFASLDFEDVVLEAHLWEEYRRR